MGVFFWSTKVPGNLECMGIYVFFWSVKVPENLEWTGRMGRVRTYDPRGLQFVTRLDCDACRASQSGNKEGKPSLW